MTSEEIKNWKPGFLKNMITGHVEAIVENEFMWLREIAYQLAVMNERAVKEGINVVLCASNDVIPVRRIE